MIGGGVQYMNHIPIDAGVDLHLRGYRTRSCVATIWQN
ncbi:hypothetical protein SYNTR_0297 [Candidatus Syntrophocurvum alkaliphilum]|uniref:Uncharacterized protein n=1 Tax=Candidatus Syntrophocurvum alkaliphilum TaxID=2293317 RepID=A0A6I6DCM6_9FIRM|nr:hypothetical protein SYNTR_0297 [Candidatus Syntrophocurvum alkaliphilum]